MRGAYHRDNEFFYNPLNIIYLAGVRATAECLSRQQATCSRRSDLGHHSSSITRNCTTCSNRYHCSRKYSRSRKVILRGQRNLRSMHGSISLTVRRSVLSRNPRRSRSSSNRSVSRTLLTTVAVTFMQRRVRHGDNGSRRTRTSGTRTRSNRSTSSRTLHR